MMTFGSFLVLSQRYAKGTAGISMLQGAKQVSTFVRPSYVLFIFPCRRLFQNHCSFLEPIANQTTNPFAIKAEIDEHFFKVNKAETLGTC
jgi:hypothetical protein